MLQFNKLIYTFLSFSYLQVYLICCELILDSGKSSLLMLSYIKSRSLVNIVSSSVDHCNETSLVGYCKLML